MRHKPKVIGIFWVVAQFLVIGGWGFTFWLNRDELARSVLQISPILVVGTLLVTSGTLLLLLGTLHLGSNFTPIPEPKTSAYLVRSGVYSRVRHPIYGGILLIVWGGTLPLFAADTVLPLASGAILTTCFFLAKSVYEEKRLIARFPDYKGYRQKLWRFIPRP